MTDNEQDNSILSSDCDRRGPQSHHRGFRLSDAVRHEWNDES